SSPLKIMLVIPHLSGGGGERVLADLAAGLEDEDVIVLVFERKSGYPITSRMISLDIPIRRQSLFSRIAGFLHRASHFRRAIRDEKPDAVISFMGESNLLTALLAPHPILTVHNHLSSFYRLEIDATKSISLRIRKKLEFAITRWMMRVLYRRATV